MKKSIFTLALLAVMGMASAQSLQFEHNGHVYQQGERLICSQPEEWGEIVLDMEVRNLTDAPIAVMIEKEEVKIVEGTENTFCWGSCFGANVFVSPRPQILEAGALSDGAQALAFHHQLYNTYSGNYAVGTSIVKYYAYPADNPDDRACLEVWFAYNAVGVSEKPSFGFGQAYPNPASSVVRFDYSISSAANVSVAVYNLLGQEVMRQQLSELQGSAAFSVADLNEGIYFCNLFVNGQAVQTQKFIVKK